MLPTFLEKLGGFFDRRFIIAFWMPVFLSVCLMVGTAAGLRGATPTLRQWDSASTTATTVLAAGGLLGVTLMALLLQALSTPLLRLYVGYWPGWLTEWGKARQTLLLQKAQKAEGEPKDKAKDKAKDSAELYYNYPPDIARLQPTRLGNIMTAAYDYPGRLYSAHASLWWSRLTPLLPETFRGQVDSALTPLFALLNLCSLLILVTLGGSVVVALMDQRWWLLLLYLLSGLALARFCYYAALSQAVAYGEQIRVGFDLYRSDVLKQMRIPLPTSAYKEYKLWQKLSLWTYGYVNPWQLRNQVAVEAEAESSDLYYDNHPAPPDPGQTVVSIAGRPVLTLTREGPTHE